MPLRTTLPRAAPRTSTPCSRSGGAAATTRPGAAFKLLLPALLLAERRRKAGTSTWSRPLGGYTPRRPTRHAQLAVILPLLTYWHRDPSSELQHRHAALHQPLLEDRALDDPARSACCSTGATIRRARPRRCSRCSGASATPPPAPARPLLLPLVRAPLGAARHEHPGRRSRSTGALQAAAGARGLFPLAYFGQQRRARATRSSSRCFWHFAGEQSSTTALVPLFYWHRDPHGYARAVTPLLLLGRPSRRALRGPVPAVLALRQRAPRDWSTTVTPLGYYHTDRDGWSVGVGPLVPLLFCAVGQDRSHFALFPLFWHFADREPTRRPPWSLHYWHRRWGGETTDALFPLFHYRRGARPGGSDETSFTLLPARPLPPRREHAACW